MWNLHPPPRILRCGLGPALLAAVLATAGPAHATDPPAEDAAAATPRFAGVTEVVASRLADDPADAGRREIVLTRAEIAALPV